MNRQKRGIRPPSLPSPEDKTTQCVRLSRAVVKKLLVIKLAVLSFALDDPEKAGPGFQGRYSNNQIVSLLADFYVDRNKLLFGLTDESEESK